MGKGPRDASDKDLRTARETEHRSSAPLHVGEGSGPGRGFINDARGGPELAVKDNANLRGDGFNAEKVDVHNETPATKNPRKAAFYGEMGRGGVKSVDNV